MATFPISTAVNIDTLTGKAGADTYNINAGGYLTIDQDTRYGTNQNVNAALGNIVLSGGGGDIEFNATKVRLIPYNTGTGNVPAYDTVVTKDGAAGKLLGVYSALNVAPTAVGAVMPASGFIKVRQWGTVVDTAEVSQIDLTFLDVDTLASNVVYFDMEDGSGPVAIYFNDGFSPPVLPGYRMIEVAMTTGIGGTDIDAAAALVAALNTDGAFTATRVDAVVTITCATTGPRTDITEPAFDSVPVSVLTQGVTAPGAGLAGIAAVATGPDRAGWIEVVAVDVLTCQVNRLNTFKVRGEWYEIGTTDGVRATTYQIPSHGLLVYHGGVFVETGPGTGAYNFFPSAGGTATVTATIANVETDSIRGRLCWIGTDGLLRFGHDGTNSTGGYCPPTGCKIRIGNVFFSGCTSAAKSDNAINANIADRYEFNTGGGGNIDIDRLSSAWYNYFQQCFNLTIVDSVFLSRLQFARTPIPITLTRCGIGPANATDHGAALEIFIARGGTLTDVVACKGPWANGMNAVTITEATDLVLTRLAVNFAQLRLHNNSNAISAGNLDNCRFDDCTISGRVQLSACKNTAINRLIYFDNRAGFPRLAVGFSAVHFTAASSGCTLDGLSLVADGCGPFYSLVQTQYSASGIKVRNIGSYASPLNLGGADRPGVGWTRSGSAATVTTPTDHLLRVGDYVLVYLADSVNAFGPNRYTVATVPSSTTFTFACNNNGALLGILSYRPAYTQNVISGGNGSSNIKVQRCHTRNSWDPVSSLDITVTQLLVENSSGGLNGFVSGGNPAASSSVYRANYFGPFYYGGTFSSYGTHWVTGFFAELVPASGVATWTRSTTVLTVTRANHGLVSGLWVNVTVTSAEDACPIGVCSAAATVLNKDVFTIVTDNVGPTSGTLEYTAAADRLFIEFNEPTALSASQVTIDAGTPVFNSQGGLFLRTVGDQITYESGVILGHTSFPPTVIETFGGVYSELHYTYAIDRGLGYGPWENLSLSIQGSTGSWIAGTNVISLPDTAGIRVGDYVFHNTSDRLFRNMQVTAIIDSETITVSGLAKVSGSNANFAFSHLPAEPTIGDSGFRMKIRMLTIIPNAAAMRTLNFWAHSTAASRQLLYPLDPAQPEVRVAVGDAALADPNAWYHLFYKDGAGAADFDAAGAVTVNDAAGVPVKGNVMADAVGGAIVFTYDYDGNTQAGLLAGANKVVVMQVEGNGVAAQARTEFTITASPLIAAACAPPVDNNP